MRRKTMPQAVGLVALAFLVSCERPEPRERCGPGEPRCHMGDGCAENSTRSCSRRRFSRGERITKLKIPSASIVLFPAEAQLSAYLGCRNTDKCEQMRDSVYPDLTLYKSVFKQLVNDLVDSGVPEGHEVVLRVSGFASTSCARADSCQSAALNTDLNANGWSAPSNSDAFNLIVANLRAKNVAAALDEVVKEGSAETAIRVEPHPWRNYAAMETELWRDREKGEYRPSLGALNRRVEISVVYPVRETLAVPAVATAIPCARKAGSSCG